LTSIETATLVGGPSANDINASSFSGVAVLQGLAGDDKLNGGGGASILIGGSGDDQLGGGGTDDLLIGGTGADRLVGLSGNDIMIAGSTSLDYNRLNPTDYTGLSAIHAEWTSNRPVAQRMNNILGTPGPGALNVGFYLIPTGPNRTVIDDASVDSLSGSSGQDWYFVHTVGTLTDNITSFGTGDFKTPID
jgi:Ca2+-binding RTX toxin-like protein